MKTREQAGHREDTGQGATRVHAWAVRSAVRRWEASPSLPVLGPLVAVVLLATAVQAADLFRTFPGVFSGDTRERTPAEATLFAFVASRAAASSRYYPLGPATSLVVVDAALPLAGLYVVDLATGSLDRLVGGHVEVVDARQTANNTRWFLVGSSGVRRGQSWESYAALVLPAEAPQIPVVSALVAVAYHYHDDVEGARMRYTVQDINGDGNDDIVFHTRTHDVATQTVQEAVTTYVWSPQGFAQQP